MKLAIAMISILVFLTGCQTASKVQDIGSGRYAVSSLACPACGGSAKSFELAMNEAQEFCSARDQVVVVEEQENRTINAVGAGGSNLIFSCVTEVTAEHTASCFDQGYAALEGSFPSSVIDKAVLTVTPPEEGFPFVVLSNQDMATPEEAKAIIAAGQVWERCSRESWSNVPPNYRKAYLNAANEFLAALARLASAKTTYGEYAAEANATLAKLDQVVGQVAKEERAQRAAEAADRRRATDNFGQMLQQATTPQPTQRIQTTCTTIGGVTSCN